MPDKHQFSDSEIISGCIKRDKKFQELLYRKYARLMYGICLSYAGERSLAQDILQESFIKVFKKIKDFNKQGSLEGWVRRIVTNTAIDHYRQTTAGRKYIYYEEAESDQDVDEKILDRINFDQILGLIKKLPEGARAIFNLYALEGYTHKEISLKLNISEGTSKSQFNRARMLLQKEIIHLEKENWQDG